MGLPPSWQGLHAKKIKKHVPLKEIEDGYNAIFAATPGLSDNDQVIISGRVFKIKEIRTMIKYGLIKVKPLDVKEIQKAVKPANE